MKMKALILFFLGLLAFTWAGEPSTIIGQRNVRATLVTFKAGANTGKTHGILLGNNVYIDTSTTGEANQFKRVDNTADSCSPPFFLGSDSLGGSRGIWENRAWGIFRSVDKDSGAMVFRVQTSELYNYGAVTAKTIVYTDWTRTGANSGYADVAVQDSVMIPVSGTTARLPQYAFFNVAGIRARLCPDDIAATANGATDTVHFDSIRVFTR